jgi:WD40 repeat protein
VLVLALLTFPLFAEGAQAQGKPKVEIIPNIPHVEWVRAAAFSPDGALLLSGSTEGMLKLWDAATGQLLRTFAGQKGPVYCVAFSPDSARLVSSGGDMLKLWDAATGQLLRTFAGHNGCALSPDGMHLAAAGQDKTVKLWDTETGRLLHTFKGHSDVVASVAFSPNGARLLSGSSDKTLKLWDAATGQLLRTFKGHASYVRSVAFSPDGARLLSGSFDKTLKLWDTETGRLLHTFEGHSDFVDSVAFSPDGAHLLSGGVDNTVRLWDEATGQLLRTLTGHSDRVLSVAFSPDGSSVLSGSSDWTMKLWDAATGQLLRTIGGRSSTVESIAFSPDGTHLLSGSRDNTLKLWDGTTGKLLRTFDHGEEVQSVAFSRDGGRVLSASGNAFTPSRDNSLKLWDAATGKLLRTINADSGSVWSAAFSPDGAHLLSGDAFGNLKLWDAETGKLLRTFEGHKGLVLSVTFSPDGGRVLSGGQDKTLKLWDAATGRIMHIFEGHSAAVWSAVFSPNGRRLLSGSDDKTLKLWDAATGELLRNVEAHASAVLSVAFSPDGTRMLSGSGDNSLKLWDASTGRFLRRFEAHSHNVNSVAFSPDGARVLSGSADTTVRLWNLSTGQLLVSLFGSRNNPAGQDHTVRLSNPGTGDLLTGINATRDSEWLALSPEGFFAASGERADRMLSVVSGLKLTTIGQVRQSLFNPDLVREVLAGDPNGEVHKAAEFINLEKVIDSGPAPAVAIEPHLQVSQSSSDLVTVQARVIDRGKGIGRIEWRVNGITAAVAAIPKGSGPDYPLAQQLALDPGDNTIEVVAYDARNVLASLPASTTIKFTGSADTVKPSLHVFAIGINAYVDNGWTPPGSADTLTFPPLNLAMSDAKALADALKQAGAGQYAEVKVTEALDTGATAAGLQQIIERMASEIHPRDTFVLFAAAHGTSHNGRFYLIPQDYDGGPNPVALQERAIGQDLLQDWVTNQIKAKRAMLLLDTCESGALVGAYRRSRTDSPASEAAIGRLHEATGRPVLTAAAEGKPAFEGYEGHGVFTWALLDALRNGDTNGDGFIELSELVSHVQDQVPKIASKLNGRGRAAVAARGPADNRQSARFGSRGEDYAVVRRLQSSAPAQ